MQYVLDCSVAIKWFLPEVLSDKALEVLRRFRAGTDSLVAPDLFLVEFGHVLRKRFVARELTADQAHAIWDTLIALRIPTFPIPPLANIALRLALTHQGQFYDAVCMSR